MADSQIKMTLPDGSVREYEAGVTGAKVAESISRKLAKDAVAIKVNGELRDLSSPIAKDSQIEIVTIDSPEGMQVFWHSSAHVMAQAVKSLFPEAKVAIGPAIAKGFYYDFDKEVPFSPEDFARIEAKFAELVKADIPFIRNEKERDEALAYFQAQGETYKVELISDLPADATISFYQQGDFTDLCRGPHLPSTGRIKAFKVLSNAGAYWRGDEKRPMLQRLYAISYASQKELDQYLELLEEAKRRDHRKLGRELDLFSFHPEAPGMVFWHHKGLRIFNALVDLWREEHEKLGYTEIKTPSMLNVDLWKRSGHWDHYQENMYVVNGGDTQYALKPMDCPDSILVYGTQKRSYRDLPIKLNEFGHLHRNEITGALNGLFRLREFTQDDSHNFVRPDQITAEISEITGLVDRFYSLFGLDYKIFLSTRPEDFMGEIEDWNAAEDALKEAIRANGKDFVVNEGDGAFYGPKLDFMVTDALQREWQLATIQLDFQLPERFELAYTDADGQEKRPVMIHRVIFGALERFIGIIIEHFAGKFPLWIAPEQVAILPVGENFLGYAQEVADQLRRSKVRVVLDTSNEKIGYKIRKAETQKIPYILVVGEKEQTSGEVAVRKQGRQDLGSMSVDQFLAMIMEKINTHALD
ncbi:MAG: threonine--tRNA ligase [Bacillota bacterium]